MDFASNAVDVSFVRHELSKLKLSKATGCDKIPAKPFKDAASVLAKPVTYLKNRHSGRKLNKLQFVRLEGRMMRTAIVQFRFSSWFLKWCNVQFKFNCWPFLTKKNCYQFKWLSMYADCNKHSTETAVAYLVDHILEDMDMQQLIGAAGSPLPPSQARALWSYMMQSYLVQKLSYFSFADSSIWKRFIIQPSSRLRRP